MIENRGVRSAAVDRVCQFSHLIRLRHDRKTRSTFACSRSTAHTHTHNIRKKIDCNFRRSAHTVHCALIIIRMDLFIRVCIAKGEKRGERMTSRINDFVFILE